MLNLIDFERPGTVMQDTSFFPLQYTCTALKVMFVAVVFFFQFPDGARVAMHHSADLAHWHVM